MNRYFAVVLALLALYELRERWQHREWAQPSGVLVSQEPRQTLLPIDTIAIPYGGNILQPLAEFEIRARLLLQKNYYFDPGAKVSSLDLCVGWGELSNGDILKKLRFNQVDRFCFYAWDNPPPVDPQIIKKSMANIHILPENDLVRETMKDLRPGQILKLTGYLVRVDYRDGGEWKSSLSREDTGDGACEVMLVKSLIVEM